MSRCLVSGGGRQRRKAGRCATEGKLAAAGRGCKERLPPGRRGPDSQPLLCSLVGQKNGIWTNRKVKMCPCNFIRDLIRRVGINPRSAGASCACWIFWPQHLDSASGLSAPGQKPFFPQSNHIPQAPSGATLAPLPTTQIQQLCS